MGNFPVNCCWMEEAARETLSPVGIYFSPKTRNYFSDGWIEAYRGIFNLLLREHIEFEIITPRTLSTAMSNLLILPDVKCMSDKEFSQFELLLKNGKTLNFTGLKGSENANPFPDNGINVTFNNAEKNAQVIFIPFPGKAQELHGVWKNGSLQVTLPEISRGAIVQLNCKSRIPYFHVPRCENGCE